MADGIKSVSEVNIEAVDVAVSVSGVFQYVC